jgi:hypothetical protein
MGFGIRMHSLIAYLLFPPLDIGPTRYCRLILRRIREIGTANKHRRTTHRNYKENGRLNLSPCCYC